MAALEEIEPGLKRFWTEHFGQNVIMLEDASAVCETIGAAIGLLEGATDIDSMGADLKDAGASAVAISATVAGLGDLAKSTGLAVRGTGTLPEKAERSENTVRL
jgi:hypothetical protein